MTSHTNSSFSSDQPTASDTIRDEEILLPYGMNRGFDEVMRCYGLGYQALNYYRYGERQSCALPLEKFWFCLSLSTHSKPEKIRRILEFEKRRVTDRDQQQSSLDVWELRSSPPENFPPSLPQ